MKHATRVIIQHRCPASVAGCPTFLFVKAGHFQGSVGILFDVDPHVGVAPKKQNPDPRVWREVWGQSFPPSIHANLLVFSAGGACQS